MTLQTKRRDSSLDDAVRPKIVSVAVTAAVAAFLIAATTLSDPVATTTIQGTSATAASNPYPYTYGFTVEAGGDINMHFDGYNPQTDSIDLPLYLHGTSTTMSSGVGVGFGNNGNDQGEFSYKNSTYSQVGNNATLTNVWVAASPASNVGEGTVNLTLTGTVVDGVATLGVGETDFGNGSGGSAMGTIAISGFKLNVAQFEVGATGTVSAGGSTANFDSGTQITLDPDGGIQGSASTTLDSGHYQFDVLFDDDQIEEVVNPSGTQENDQVTATLVETSPSVAPTSITLDGSEPGDQSGPLTLSGPATLDTTTITVSGLTLDPEQPSLDSKVADHIR